MDDIRVIADEFQDGAPGYVDDEFQVLTDGPIKKVEDLKGKVVATNAAGSGVDVAMRAMLHKHGLEPNRDYTVIEAPFPAMRAMLAEKKVDLIPTVLPFSLDPELKKIAHPSVHHPRCHRRHAIHHLVARKPFIDAHRAALVDFLEDSLRIAHWYLDPKNHEAAAADRVTAHQAAAGAVRLAIHQERLLPRSEYGAESRRAAEECRHHEADLGFVQCERRRQGAFRSEPGRGSGETLEIIDRGTVTAAGSEDWSRERLDCIDQRNVLPDCGRSSTGVTCYRVGVAVRFRTRGCPWATGGRKGLNLSAALFAGLIFFACSAPARASPGCNIGDIVNAAGNSFGAFTSDACDATYATGPGGITAAGLIVAGLEALAATGNGGTVNTVCSDLNTVSDDLGSIASWLQASGISGAQDIASAIADVPGLDPFNVAECGCAIQEGVNQLVSDLGDCLCDLVSWIPGVNCNNCTPPPPIQANCALPTTCFVAPAIQRARPTILFLDAIHSWAPRFVPVVKMTGRMARL